MHAILNANLIGRCPVTDLFTATGCKWLADQALPLADREAIDRSFREIARVGEDLASLDRALAEQAVDYLRLKRLMTITGIDMVPGLGLIATIGDHTRFASSEKLVSYLGLNPSVRQSGSGPARHGRITKQGANHARALLVEAAWAASRVPGSLHSFFMRVMSRRGSQVAAVATARKLAAIIWHVLNRQEDYVFARPSLVARKRRSVELRAGLPRQRGRRGIAAGYYCSETRAAERERALFNSLPTVEVVDRFGTFKETQALIRGSGTDGRASHHESRELMYRICGECGWWDWRTTRHGKGESPVFYALLA